MFGLFIFYFFKFKWLCIWLYDVWDFEIYIRSCYCFAWSKWFVCVCVWVFFHTWKHVRRMKNIVHIIEYNWYWVVSNSWKTSWLGLQEATLTIAKLFKNSGFLQRRRTSTFRDVRVLFRGACLFTTDVRPIKSGVCRLGLIARFWHEFLETSNGFQHIFAL